jgi:hypothetical protein
MELISVTSSNISAIGYNDQTATLTIQFIKNNDTYEYYDVPQYEYDGLMAAGSHGVYANANIYKVYRQQKL